MSLKDEPKFLFLINPPHSGSTAIAKILNTSPCSMVLTDNAEGQWLVPEMCADDRWDINKIVDWKEVKRVWFDRYSLVNSLVGNIQVIIEKSPPNLLRVNSIRSEFDNCCFFAFNRNPYANCASILRRNFGTFLHDGIKRLEVVAYLAEQWLFRSRYIIDSILKFSIKYGTYESFCLDTKKSADSILTICPELTSVNDRTEIQVKDYDVQTVVDMNSQQVTFLTSKEIIEITRVLIRDEDCLKFFGYGLL